MTNEQHQGKVPGRRDKVGRLASLGMVGVLAWMAVGMGARDEAAALPADLAVVAADAQVMVSIRVADLWNNEVIKPARQQLAKELAEPIADFEKKFGALPEHVERLTVVIRGRGPDEEILVVALNRPYDRDKVQALAGPGARPETFKGRSLFVSGTGNAVVLMGPQAYALGKAEPLKSLLDQPAAEKAGPLSAARRAALQRHAVVVGVNVPALAAEAGEDLPPAMEPFKPLLAAQSATLTADVGAPSRARLVVPFAGADAAAKGLKPLRAAVKLLCTTVAAEKKRAARQGIGAPLGNFFDLADTVLKDTVVEQDGAVLRATAQVKIDAATLAASLADSIRQQHRLAPRLQSINNLKQILLAMHNYQGTFGHLPQAAVFDKSGKPLLSWRVLILPFIEQDALYRQFHLDEPWDSEHNKKLLEAMPPVYAAPGKKKSNQTYYLAFWGKGAAFEGKKALRLPTDFPDGLSNTLMIAEAAKAVPWSKPEDLDYDPDKPLPKLGGLFEDGFHAARCDASVHFFRRTIKPTTLHLLIQRNDGQAIPDDF